MRPLRTESAESPFVDLNTFSSITFAVEFEFGDTVLAVVCVALKIDDVDEEFLSIG